MIRLRKMPPLSMNRIPLPRLFRTFTFRLALLYISLFASSVLLLLVFLYWATAGYMAQQLEETIAVEVRSLAEHYERNGATGLMRLIEQRINANPQGSFWYLLITADKQRLAGNLNAWPPEQAVENTANGFIDFEFLKTSGNLPKPHQHKVRAQTFRLLPGPLFLLVGRDTRELDASRQLIHRALAWGLAFTLWMGVVGGILMSAGVVQRLEAINHTSRAIMRGQLSQRIPRSNTDDEFDQLAQNLNSMLDRIEALMATVRHVSDNIAHDLKTPLTRLRNRLEQVLVKPPTWETFQEKIAEAIIEADQLLNTFNALLRIARIEGSTRGQAEAVVDLYALAQDAADLYEVMAEEKQQQFSAHLTPELKVRGDRDLLFQALLNLLDNAIKYTPEGGSIVLELQRQATHIVLSVTDSGSGIPVEAREQVLRRFFRLESARNTPGNGLGLSLVAAVAEAHQAQLRLDDNPHGNGLRVSLLFAAQGA